MNPASIVASISGYVLVGGTSSRLGRDKVLLPWMGSTLLDHAIARLQQMCGTVSVCGGRSDLREHLLPRIKIIPDAIGGCGPLGGIVAALERSHTDWNLFLAVDLPLIPVEFLQSLVRYKNDRHSLAREARCILPHVESLPQPLCGLYRRSLALGMRRALEEGKYKIMHALHSALKNNAEQESPQISEERGEVHIAREAAANGIKFLDVDSFDLPVYSTRIDPKDWFLNINTESDLRQALDLIRDSDPRVP